MPSEQFERNDPHAASRGRARLMLRLPSARDILRTVRSPWLEELFEAYELASCALHHFRQSASGQYSVLVIEYEVVCSEIEEDVLRGVGIGHISR